MRQESRASLRLALVLAPVSVPVIYCRRLRSNLARDGAQTAGCCTTLWPVVPSTLTIAVQPDPHGVKAGASTVSWRCSCSATVGWQSLRCVAARRSRIHARNSAMMDSVSMCVFLLLLVLVYILLAFLSVGSFTSSRGSPRRTLCGNTVSLLCPCRTNVGDQLRVKCRAVSLGMGWSNE